MILINLLPHRELARKRRKDVFNVSLGFAALVGVLISVLVLLWFQAEIAAQQLAQIDEILFPDRPVEAVFDHQLGIALGADAALARHGENGVDRDQPDEAEGTDRDADQRRHDQSEAVEDEAQHGPGSGAAPG